MNPILSRSFPVIDMEIMRGGDGRTVTAFAATFDDPYEVMDAHGHYYEQINRAAFNRALGRGIQNVQVFYNHGRNPAGGPAPMELTRGIGVPLSITAEPKGLLTVTRYGTSPLAEGLLQDIKDGIIRAQSFRGPIYRDAPPQRHASGLQLVERMALGLIEYGPSPLPVNLGAEMVAVRSATELFGTDPAEWSADERAAALSAIGAQDLTPPPAPGVPAGTAEDLADETPLPIVVDLASDPMHLAQRQRRRRAS